MASPSRLDEAELTDIALAIGVVGEAHRICELATLCVVDHLPERSATRNARRPILASPLPKTPSLDDFSR